MMLAARHVETSDVPAQVALYFGSMSESPPEYRVSAMGVERCRNRTRHCSPSSAKYMASVGLNARAQEVVTGAPL